MQNKPKISVVIGTYNRPQMLRRAVDSVLKQTFQDFEVIVVDDGMEERAGGIVAEYHDDRIRYIQHEENKGCSASKNTGARNARGGVIAFLDDDDWWVPEKLEVQYNALQNTSSDVGFSFTAVLNVHENFEERTHVPEGIADYHERALLVFNGFMAGTLMVKRGVFYDVGYLDESYPSHTDIEWIIRVTKKYKGLGIDEPLLCMDFSEHEHMGSDPLRRAHGREMLLSKYKKEFKEMPEVMAKHLFKLATFYREGGDYKNARNAFLRSLKAHFSVRTLLHYLSMFFAGRLYRTFYSLAERLNIR